VARAQKFCSQGSRFIALANYSQAKVNKQMKRLGGNGPNQFIPDENKYLEGRREDGIKAGGCESMSRIWLSVICNR